ncbi:MAG TPA: NAD(P)-binding domain-containing protein [Acidimicrobiia bacterium]|nr:NAD(P)-binding domain-containing protein [Acidimicrobiia bacterium]
MNIAVLGTGVVGQTVAARLAELGHQVSVGTRSVEAAMARNQPDRMGNPPFSAWADEHLEVSVATFAAAAAQAELVVNATNGAASLVALEAAGEENLAGKIIIDIANPLDFTQGMPPSLLVFNDDSLGEQIQLRFPRTRVVKTLNTVNAYLMVDPKRLAGGDHTVFVSGNDAEAKATVTELLQSLGWSDIIDLGDITTARGTEMYLPLWLRIWGAIQAPMFNVRVVR